MKVFLAVLLALYLAPAAGAALLDNSGGNGLEIFTITGAAGNLFAHALPTTPLDKGLREAKLTLGFFTSRRKYRKENPLFPATPVYTDQKVSGGGGAASYIHGLSKHWGLSALAGYVSGDGKFMSNGFPSGGDQQQKAFNVAANVIWDGYTGDNFRFPLMIGLSYMDYDESAGPLAFVYPLSSSLAGHNGSAKQTYKYGEFGFAVGAAPQFNTGPFRWVPFGFGISAINMAKRRYTETDLTTGQRVTKGVKTDQSGVSVTGIQLIYRPWNLNYTYIIPYLSEVDTRYGDSLAAHSFTISRKF